MSQRYFVRLPNDRGGGYCLADGLPDTLRKGLNIDFMFGNVTYIWAKTPGETKTYNPTRFDNLMSQSDWNNIRTAFANQIIGYIVNAQTNEQTPIYKYEATGFDHVRLLLEPMAFCNPDGTVPIDGGTDPKWLNVIALAKQLWKIKEAGLGVILDLHPDVRTQHQYATTYATEISASGKTVYPGPTTFDLATAYHQPNRTFNPASHPLVKFWSTFPDSVDKAFADLAENSGGLHLDPDKVFFEILNEPLMNLAKVDFPETGPDSELHEDQPFIDAWTNLFVPGWKAIQLAAIQQVRNWNSEFRCIATTALSDPRDVANDTAWMGGYFGDPYNSADLSGYEKYVIYNMHFYEPFRLTHNAPWIEAEPHYSPAGYAQWRDYFGQWQNPTDSLNTFTNPNFRGLPQDDFLNGAYTYSGHVAMQPMFTHLSSWRASHPVNGGAVAMMINEFGCKKQYLDCRCNEMWDPEPPGGVTENMEYDGVARDTWYSVARRKMQDDGYGWTAFDYTGGFAVYNGKLFSQTDPNDWVSHGSIKARIKDALFLGLVLEQPEGGF